MKKLSIILAMLLALTTFSGCEMGGDKSEKKEDKEVVEQKDKKAKDSVEEEEDGPETIVDAFFSDAFARELGDYEDYFLEDADAEEDFETFKNMDFVGDIASITAIFGDSGEELIDAIYGTMEYEIGDVEEDGDAAEVTVTLKAPDFDNVEVDEEDILLEVMGLDPETATEEELMDWMEENGLDENSTDEEVMEVFGEDLLDYIVKVFEDAEKTEEEFIYVVEKNDDGEWRIASVKDKKSA